VGETLGSELMEVSHALQPAYAWPMLGHFG